LCLVIFGRIAICEFALGRLTSLGYFVISVRTNITPCGNNWKPFPFQLTKVEHVVCE